MTESKQVFKYGSPIEKSVEPLGVVAQFWLEHRPVTPEVASSSLVYPAIKHFSLRSAFRLNLEAYCGVNIDDKALVHLKEGVLAVRFKFTRPDIAESGIEEHGKTP